MKLLQEFYELKSNLLGNEDDILKNIEGSTIEETTTNIINWFMFNDATNDPKASSLCESPLSKVLNHKKGERKEAK